MKRFILALLIALTLGGCANQPGAVSPESETVGGFFLDAPYDSIAGIGKFKITLGPGRYRPVYKDAKGYYFFCRPEEPGVFVTLDKSEAWIIMLAHEPKDGFPLLSNGAVPVLIAALVAPPGSVSKARQLKADFLAKVRWEEPIQSSPPTPGS